MFIIYIPRLSSCWQPFYFKPFQNAQNLLLHTAKRQIILSIGLLIKTFVNNVNEGKDMT